MKYIVLAIVSIACTDDYLETEPQGTLTTNDYFVNQDEISESLTATYDALGHQKAIGMAWSPFLTLAEVLSDDAYAGGGSANDGRLLNELNTFTISLGNDIVRSTWKRNYVGVYRANHTLDKATALAMESDTVDISQIAAEARFLRAYFYFELVRFFENVPLFTSVPAGISDGIVEQADPSDVYNLIAGDLVYAAQNLPASYPTSDLGRATRWAAKAMLARVYLFESGVYGIGMSTDEGVNITSDYVYGELEDVITNSGHDLMDNFADVFSQGGEYSEESIFEVAYNDAPITGDWGNEHNVEGNLAAQQMGPRVEANSNLFYRGWSFGVMSEKLFQDMTNDPRLDATILTEETILEETGVTYTNTAYQHTGYFNRKYTTSIENRPTDGSTELFNRANYRVLRFSDVLLMAAEIGQNVSYLNRVRERVGLDGLSTYSEEALFNERRMELSGEGIRYFDLLRRGLDVAAVELSISNQIGEYYNNPVNEYNVSFNRATRGFLPIPFQEIILTNGVLQQNEGY